MWRRLWRCRWKAIASWWISKLPSFRGAREASEPGISRFRVWSFGPSRNDDCAPSQRRAPSSAAPAYGPLHDKDSGLILLLRLEKARSPRDAIVRPACDKTTRRADFRFRRRANHLLTPRILSPRKGRWPSSRTLGQDAVDAAASCARWDGRAGFQGP
jgi:hypothetical protein